VSWILTLAKLHSLLKYPPEKIEGITEKILFWFLFAFSLFFPSSILQIWTVPLSLQQAIKLLISSKQISFIIAVSFPLLISWNNFPVSVKNNLIKVPFSEAVAIILPLELREIKAILVWCAEIEISLFFSIFFILICPIPLSGYATIFKSLSLFNPIIPNLFSNVSIISIVWKPIIENVYIFSIVTTKIL